MLQQAQHPISDEKKLKDLSRLPCNPEQVDFIKLWFICIPILLILSVLLDRIEVECVKRQRLSTISKKQYVSLTYFVQLLISIAFVGLFINGKRKIE
ncbi:unnamed protein product [Didymodactylos carnosus]|uniref:Uncharacterized protein n=1 Tax=Didymodactylos carnosus TaxID=1234261 RepID=A0A814YAN5_9BILA|nr:unnamed protein product [Didymodactylos carnosus]CAF1226711.1 unnamed protein product [Didymodactylos carnosus]CAF3803498.1 unnamed protein product [Didymodactylos carnosus]CAF3989651.1 unnamed protein product [Didymodactylos carnosus]